MAYPGDRRRKIRLPILASVVTGTIDYDFPATLTHADFVDSAKTLGGANAIAQGGADLAFSLDSEGTTWLAREIVRCDLSATPADSRIEIKVTIPASHISDTADSYIYAWFGSETETQPAADADYGKYDVWNGPARDGFTPLVTWGVWHHDEDPSDPAPPHKDSSGNGRHATPPSGSTRADIAPGRGVILGSAVDGATNISGQSFSPGTNPFALIQTAVTHESKFLARTNTGTARALLQVSSSSGQVTLNGTSTSATVSLDTTVFLGVSRNGDNGVRQVNTTNALQTGLSSVNFAGETNFTWSYNGASRIGFTAALSVGPNQYWMRLMSDNLVGTSIWGTPEESQPAAITEYVYFDGLQAGTEVRIYEEPHPQEWTVDLDGITPSALNDAYIAFQIQGSSSASDHYVWFDYNSTGTDPEPGGTGHEVSIATGDTIADVAESLQTVLAAITDLDASVSGTIVTATNERNGELAEPTDGGTDAAITLVQVGGTATDEIDGIESSTGTSWTATYTVLRPRRVTIVMLSIAYENVRYSATLTTAGLTVPAGALQREDRNYLNPA